MHKKPNTRMVAPHGNGMATPAGLQKSRYIRYLACLTQSHRIIEPESELSGLSNRDGPSYRASDGANHNEKAAGRASAGGSQIVRGFEKSTGNSYHAGLQPASQITLLSKWRLACEALRDPALSVTAKCVFVLLLEEHYCNTGRCAPSTASIGAKLGRGRDAIFEAVRSLEENGWVRVRRNRGSRSNYTFAWERQPATAGSLAALAESGGEIPTSACVNSSQTGREIPAPAGRENPTLNQGDNRKYISHSGEGARGVIPQAPRTVGAVGAVRSEIELPSAGAGEFEQFWQAFPKREGRAAAQREWTGARAAGVTASLLLTGAQRYAKTCATREARWIASPANWLRGQRWLDDEPDRSGRAAPAAPPAPDDEIARAVRQAKAPRDEATWVFIQEGSPEWRRWRGAFAHARVALESGVGRLVESETAPLSAG